MSDRPQRRRRGAPFHHAPEAVTYAREQAGLSQKELAERCGISQSLMCDIEAGRRNATPVTLRRMAAALNCPLVVLQSKRPDVPAPTDEAKVAVRMPERKAS
ncbi:multiprotein-bridging factor 1 family protein [Streptomyces sp. NPDC059679]|uniref:helix-turn-helix domain-containing protein n=1 Tax=Streptomyces sp. NPDC059679 TaxID=3346903 RepID=UPI00368A36C8